MLASLALATIVLQDVNRMGLSSADILRMGRSNWVETYVNHFGKTSSDLVTAQSTYGEVLFEFNEGQLKNKSAATRAALRGLRRYAIDFQMNLIDLKACFSGGGTMWAPIRAGVVADVEELLQPLVLGRCRPQNRWTAVALVKNFDYINAQIGRNSKAMDRAKDAEISSKAARSLLKSARKSFDRIAEIAGKRSQDESDWILEFCNGQLQFDDVL